MSETMREPNDDPNDPSHPDHDLSEAAPYIEYPAPPKPWYMRRWLLMIVAVITITGLLLPYLRDIF
jgi:hypothetical protein